MGWRDLRAALPDRGLRVETRGRGQARSTQNVSTTAPSCLRSRALARWARTWSASTLAPVISAISVLVAAGGIDPAAAGAPADVPRDPGTWCVTPGPGGAGVARERGRRCRFGSRGLWSRRSRSGTSGRLACWTHATQQAGRHAADVLQLGAVDAPGIRHRRAVVRPLRRPSQGVDVPHRSPRDRSDPVAPGRARGTA